MRGPVRYRARPWAAACHRRRLGACAASVCGGKSNAAPAGCHTVRAHLNRRQLRSSARFKMSTLPARMTVIGIKAPGGPEVLVPEERQVPTPCEGDILIRVRAAGVNRPDVMQRKGLYPPPPGASDIPGLDTAGEIAALGPAIGRWQGGERALALV